MVASCSDVLASRFDQRDEIACDLQRVRHRRGAYTVPIGMSFEQFDLTGRVAIITGGGTGIGAATGVGSSPNTAPTA